LNTPQSVGFVRVFGGLLVCAAVWQSVRGGNSQTKKT
jgi:hypothetical protein